MKPTTKYQISNVFIKGLLLAILVISPAHAATTGVTQTIDPGPLTLATPLAATMVPVTIDATQAQSSHGSLGALAVTDSRGSAAGWSLTASATNFYQIGTPQRTQGADGSLAAGGIYTGTTNASYGIKIVSAGPVGSAQFVVTDTTMTPLTTAATPVPIDSSGVTVSFGAGQYQVGDQWSISVSLLSTQGLTITPSGVTTNVGDPTGVVPGSSRTLTNPLLNATIMTANPGYGVGEYSNTPSLGVTVPYNAAAGAYTATITETVN